MRCIPLTNHPWYAIVDDADYERVAAMTWSLSPSGYVQANTRSCSGLALHRFVVGLVGAARGVQIDHRDRVKLNNRRGNLRPCTAAQNTANQPKVRSRAGVPTTSRFKGVHLRRDVKRSRPWSAVLVRSGKCVHLGDFDDEREAAFAYDRAALAHFGEFARTNFPSPSNR
jgi:hypothetical protein